MIRFELAMNDRTIRELDTVVCEREARAVSELQGQVRLYQGDRVMLAGDPCWKDGIVTVMRGYRFSQQELGAAAADAVRELTETIRSRWSWSDLFPAVAMLDELWVQLVRQNGDVAETEHTEPVVLRRVGS